MVIEIIYTHIREAGAFLALGSYFGTCVLIGNGNYELTGGTVAMALAGTVTAIFGRNLKTNSKLEKSVADDLQ